jgi:hypothetical protein
MAARRLISNGGMYSPSRVSGGGKGNRAGNVWGEMNPDTGPPSGRKMLIVMRIGLPLVIAAVGVVMILIGHGRYSDLAHTQSLESAIGVALLLVAVIVWMIAWMARMSVESNRDREVEEEAREYFDRHGYWPDEGPR